MATEISVNPEVLVWARKEAGYLTPESGATRLKIDVDELLLYETGKKKPTIDFLERVSKRYPISLAALLMPDTLPHSELPKDFRTFEGRPPILHPKTLDAIRSIEVLIDSLIEIRDENPDLVPTPRLAQVDINSNPANLARVQRRILGIDIEEQLSWRNSTDAWWYWRSAIESLGVFVHQFRFDAEDNCRGISFIRDKIFTICINGADTTEAKIFSLIHEYVHLLLRDAGISDQNKVNGTERFCNTVAANFLVPRNALIGAANFPEGSAPREWDEGAIQQLAQQFKVSVESMTLRLEETGLAPKGFYKFKKDEWAKTPFVRRIFRSKASYGEKMFRRYGLTCTNTVLNAVDAGVINRIDAGNILGVKTKYLAPMRRALTTRITAYGKGPG